jgi:YfiH family protein
VTERPVSWVDQVHGSRVVVVERPGDATGVAADALVTTNPGAALAVVGADCATVALASPEGVVGAAHAGWRGLLEGVLENTVEAMRQLGATTVEAALGPCIHAECYEFGADRLDEVADRLGASVRGTTAWGAPALDVPAATAAALARAGASLVHDEDVCTACAAEHCFSARARGESDRQALVVWRE